MSVHEVTYYQLKCDGCGQIVDDYGDFSALNSPEFLHEYLPEWLQHEGRDYCGSCFYYDDDDQVMTRNGHTETVGQTMVQLDEVIEDE